MISVTGYFSVQGPSFSPRRVEAATSVKFTYSNEPGDLAQRGRYKGQPLPYGSGALHDDNAGHDLLAAGSELLTKAHAIIASCRDAGATSFLLHLNVEYWEQCNLEFPPDFIAAVAALGVDFTMTCYEGDPASKPGARNA